MCVAQIIESLFNPSQIDNAYVSIELWCHDVNLVILNQLLEEWEAKIYPRKCKSISLSFSSFHISCVV